MRPCRPCLVSAQVQAPHLVSVDPTGKGRGVLFPEGDGRGGGRGPRPAAADRVGRTLVLGFFHGVFLERVEYGTRWFLSWRACSFSAHLPTVRRLFLGLDLFINSLSFPSFMLCTQWYVEGQMKHKQLTQCTSLNPKVYNEIDFFSTSFTISSVGFYGVFRIFSDTWQKE